MRAYVVLWVMLCLGWLYGMAQFGSLFHLTIWATAILDFAGLIYTSTAMIIGGWPKGET